MAAPAPAPTWRLQSTDEFKDEVRRACGRDGGLRSRVEKKIRKILDGPERVGEWKSGALKGLKAEYVNPFVILFSFEGTPDDPPGVVHLRGFWHHNDRRYDPSG